jgi:hypothetical protein
MKSNRVIIAIAVFLAVLSPVCAVAQARGSDEPRNCVSVDLLWPGVWCIAALFTHPQGVIPLTFDYQRVLFDHLVLSVQPGAWISDGVDSLRVYLEADIHPFNKGLRGFFIGLSEGAIWWLKSNSVGLPTAANIGYQVVFRSKLVLTAAVGRGFLYTVTNPTGITWGFPARASLEIGYSF